MLNINTQIQACYPNKYSINLIWLNQKKILDQVNLLTPLQLNNLFAWSYKNPNSKVNLWLDSKLTCQQAIKKLRAIIKQANLEKKIKLCDIRKLETVINFPEIFDWQIPVYFRVDLIKIIIATESLKKDVELCFVYSDFDIKPIPKRKLFDRKTCRLLKKYHFVLAKANNKCGFENGFQIFSYQQNLILALEQTLIQASIAQAQKFLASLREKSELIANYALRTKRAELQETIFRAYPNMLNTFERLESPNQPQSDYAITKNVPTKKITMPTSTSTKFEIENC